MANGLLMTRKVYGRYTVIPESSGIVGACRGMTRVQSVPGSSRELMKIMHGLKLHVYMISAEPHLLGCLLLLHYPHKTWISLDELHSSIMW